MYETGSRAEDSTHEPRPTGDGRGDLRESVYKIARVLSIVLGADGLLMAWALVKDGYGLLGYVQFSFMPLFIPAFVMGLLISAIFVHGFARRSWTVRQTELLFFLLFSLAVAAKVTFFLE